MTSVDKDFRFMATNDLMTELQNDSIKLDDDSERKVIKLDNYLKRNFVFLFTLDCQNSFKTARRQKW